MSNSFEEYFGTAGDMASGSQNPAEQNDWFDKQQKELARQKKALERQQTLAKPVDPFTAPATGLTPAFGQETAMPKSEPLKIEPLKMEIPKSPSPETDKPENPLSGGRAHQTVLTASPVSETAHPEIDLHIAPEDAYTTLGKTWGQQKLIGIYDKQTVPRREQPKEWHAALARRASHIPTLSSDVQDCLFRFHCQTNPPFRQQIQDEIRQMHRIMPDIQSGSAQSLTPNDPSEAFMKPPEETGQPIPSVTEEKGRQINNDSPEPKTSLLQQALSVNLPQDMSLNPVVDFLNGHPKNLLGDNPLWKADPPGHLDLSYGSFGETVAGAAQSGLGEESAIHGKDKSRIAGPLDESYDPLIGDVSENLGTNSAVTGHGRETISAPNQSYWVNWEDEQGRQIPLDLAAQGVRQGMADAQDLFYSGASLTGELIYKLVGGDDKALRQIQALMEQHRKERKKRDPLNINELYVEGDAEKTMQNVTQYLYQELGNQLVNVPAYIVLGQLKTFAELTGVSTAVLAAQIHGDIREKTGESKAMESVMYAIPLGLMSALLMPFRQVGELKGAQDVRNYVGGLLVGFGVHKAQQEQEKKIVERHKGRGEGNALR